MTSLTIATNRGSRERVALYAMSFALAFIALFTLTEVCRVHSQGTEILIENFEGTDPLAAWELTTSSSAVSATLHLGEGYEGHGGHLNYELNGGMSEFVEATSLFTESINARAVSLWVKSPAGVSISFNVRNQDGSFQDFSPTRPFQATNPDGWYRHVIRFEGLRPLYGVAIQVRLMTYVPQASGEIAFDEIVALPDPVVFQIDPENIPVASATFSVGTFHSILGVDYNQREGADEQALSIAQAVGMHYVRTDALRWHALETSPGYYDFSAGDSIVTEHEARGIETIFNIHGGNVYHTGAWNNPPLTDAQLTAFGNYVEAVAQHYRGRGMIYDIWSEPQLPIWNPPLQADQFAAILKEATQRISRADPTAKIITGGVLFLDPNYLRDVINAGGADGADGFGIHSYNIGPPEALSDELLMVRSVISQSHLDSLPIWDTERGFSSAAVGGTTISEARRHQAKEVARLFLSGWANGLSSVVYWNFRDEGEDPSQVFENFGLVDYSYNEKPAFQAVRTLSEVAEGRILTGLIDNLPSEYYGLKLDGTQDVIIVLWTKDYGAPLTVTVPISSTAINFLGESVTLTPMSDTLVLTVSESVGPIYITCKLCSTSRGSVFLPVVLRQ